MIFNLANPLHVERSKRRLEALIKKEAIVELTEKNTRSLSQNSYLHVILTHFGMETGYTLNESKQIYKWVNRDIYEIALVTPDDERAHGYRSSSDLSVEEMTKSIEVFRNYSANEAGVHLPAPDEERFLQMIQVEASQNNYL